MTVYMLCEYERNNLEFLVVKVFSSTEKAEKEKQRLEEESGIDPNDEYHYFFIEEALVH